MKYIIFLIVFPSVAYADTYNIARLDKSVTTVERPVSRAFAYAPNVISKCSGSLAGGAQGQFAGISFAGSYKDEFCERAELIKLVIAMGHYELADQLLMEFPMIRELQTEETIESCDYPTKCRRRR